MSDGRVLEARGLVRRYQAEGSPIRAVDGVDLVVEAGETVSVMGPSGCGKSTLLPLPGVLGMRSAWRRPGRLLTNAAGLLLGVAMIVVALALRDSLDLLDVTPPEPGHAASDAAVAVLYDQIRAIILGTAGLLLVLATINAFIVAAFAARDAARNQAVLRAVGATPRQTVTALIVSQLGACAVAVVVGIPLGLGLWSLMEGGDLPAVSVPALLLARRPVAPVLAYE
jgi:hypothetical protein